MSKRLAFILQISVSLILLVLLFRLVDWSQITKIWRGMKYEYILWLVFLVTADRIFMAYKWYLLLKRKHPTVIFSDAIKAYYVGTLFGLFLPVSVGADIIKMVHLHMAKKEGSVLVSSVVMEKLLGFIAAIIMAMFSLLLLTFVFRIDVHIFIDISIILLFILLLTLFLSLRNGILNWVKKFLGPKDGRLRVKVGSIYNAYLEYKRAKPLLVWFLFLSCLEQLLPVVGNYLAADALGIKMSFFYFLAIIPVVQLFTRLPVSLNGLGVNEGLLIYFFTLLGLSSTHAFSIGILGQICLVFSLLPALFFWRPGRRLEQSQNLTGANSPVK